MLFLLLLLLLMLPGCRPRLALHDAESERYGRGSGRALPGAYHRGHEHGNYQAKRRSAPASPLKVVTLGDWATLRVLDRRRGAHSGTQQRIEAELDRRRLFYT